MTTLTGKCMLLVEVLTPQSTARVTDTMLLLILLPKRYINNSVNFTITVSLAKLWRYRDFVEVQV